MLVYLAIIITMLYEEMAWGDNALITSADQKMAHMVEEGNFIHIGSIELGKFRFSITKLGTLIRVHLHEAFTTS